PTQYVARKVQFSREVKIMFVDIARSASVVGIGVPRPDDDTVEQQIAEVDLRGAVGIQRISVHIGNVERKKLMLFAGVFLPVETITGPESMQPEQGAAYHQVVTNRGNGFGHIPAGRRHVNKRHDESRKSKAGLYTKLVGKIGRASCRE